MFEEAKDKEKEVESLMQAYELENYLNSSKLIDSLQINIQGF